jgi:aminoglycoside phosphotransferase (APT) family kinase protein
MAAVDPRDSVAVAEVLRARAAERWGAVELAEAPSAIGAGFDSYIHLVQLRGPGLPAEWAAALVVRILPSPDREAQAHREADAQAWSRSVGYGAPHILEVLGADEGFGLPVQVMERAPGSTMLDAILHKPWRTFALIDQLARLQLALHALPTDGWPGSVEPRELVDRRLGLTRRAVAELGDPDLTDAMQRVEAVVPEGLGGDLVVCHGDFHPLNVVVDGDHAAVIDWSDAGLGPREADVARTLLLFQVASIAATSSVERVALKVVGPRMRGRYRRAYERSMALDPRRLLVWEALHALHGWSQVLTLHAGGFEGASSSAGDEARAPLAVGEWLHARFDQALADLAS